MALSDEWWEYHLTSQGWVAGSEHLDSSFNEVAPPEGTVLTVRWVEYVSSTHSKQHRAWEEQWRSPNTGAVDELVAKYGAHPDV